LGFWRPERELKSQGPLYITLNVGDMLDIYITLNVGDMLDNREENKNCLIKSTFISLIVEF
jgi:hypothetical protein